jgi:hypothetical protein
MPDESPATTPEVIGSRTLRETFNENVKAIPAVEEATPTREVENEKSETPQKTTTYSVDESLSPEERMEKLLEVDQDTLSPVDLAKFKKDLYKGFTKATQRAAKKSQDAEERLAKAKEQLEQYEPLLRMWDQDETFREQTVKYVQKRNGSSQPSKSEKMEKFLADFSPEQRQSLEQFYEVIREDVLSNIKADDPVARKRLEELESRVELEQRARITQDVERMEKRFHEACPSYKELPVFWQNQFELKLKADFAKDPNVDPVESYRSFERETAALSSKERSTQLDELSSRPNRVPQPPGGTSGSSEPKFTRGQTSKEAFWHFMKSRRA